MMKPWLSICVSCGLTLAAVSCGDDDETDEVKVVIPIAGTSAPPPVNPSGTPMGNGTDTSNNQGSGAMTTPGGTPNTGTMPGSGTPNPGSVPPPPPPPLPSF